MTEKEIKNEIMSKGVKENKQKTIKEATDIELSIELDRCWAMSVQLQNKMAEIRAELQGRIKPD